MATKRTSTPAKSKPAHPKKSGAHAKTQPAPRSHASGAGATGAAGIRIRMYRVGFGDFFLLTFSTDQGDEHVIIDCGCFKGTSGTGDIGSIEAAIANMVEETKGKVALIIMTHRHADHIAGFGRFPDSFRNLEVGAVWMPIWETEYDPRAKKFQAELTALAEGMQAQLAFQLAASGHVDPEVFHIVGNATGIEPLGAAAKGGGGASKNAVALELLKGFGKGPQYLKAGDSPVIPDALKVAGLSAQVLGPPPLDDVELMKLMDLKKNVGEYLAMANAAASDVGAWEPFSSAWYDDQGSMYPNAAFREWMPKRGVPNGEEASQVRTARQRLAHALHGASPTGLAAAANKIDSFLNNQSLVVLFTFRGKKLLFVGDAQGGNWEHWLYETDEADKAPTGALAASAKEILDGVDVYKVGHHGSTNATPIVVSKEIREDAVALCSTQEGVYGSKTETAVPLVKLIDALDERCKLVRSDQLEIEVDGKTIKAAVDRKLPELSAGKWDTGALWIDYVL